MTVTHQEGDAYRIKTYNGHPVNSDSSAFKMKKNSKGILIISHKWNGYPITHSYIVMSKLLKYQSVIGFGKCRNGAVKDSSVTFFPIWFGFGKD